jgi:hypothetical protein
MLSRVSDVAADFRHAARHIATAGTQVGSPVEYLRQLQETRLRQQASLSVAAEALFNREYISKQDLVMSERKLADAQRERERLSDRYSLVATAVETCAGRTTPVKWILEDHGFKTRLRVGESAWGFGVFVRVVDAVATEPDHTGAAVRVEVEPDAPVELWIGEREGGESSLRHQPGWQAPEVPLAPMRSRVRFNELRYDGWLISERRTAVVSELYLLLHDSDYRPKPLLVEFAIDFEPRSFSSGLDLMLKYMNRQTLVWPPDR